MRKITIEIIEDENEKNMKINLSCEGSFNLYEFLGITQEAVYVIKKDWKSKIKDTPLAPDPDRI